MHDFELILILFGIVVILSTAAQRLNIPYPVILVVGGLILGILPGLPNIHLAPDTIFLLFLPPALFAAAVSTDWWGFRADVRPITTLAVNLVLTTTVGVAVVAVAVMAHISWSVAFVIGAIVSPPDAVATLAIVRRLGVPRRLITVLSGESLINDATALVTYRFAVAAVVTGSFSLWKAAADFIYVVIAGIAVGVIISVVVSWFLTKVVDNVTLGIAATLLAPIACYLPAEEIGASGVLAVVAAGLYFSRRTNDLLPAVARLQGVVIWDFMTFLIDGLVFMLIGLQLPTILDQLGDRSTSTLIWYAAVISAATIAIRIAFVLLTMSPHRRHALMQFEDAKASHRSSVVMAWAGPRGMVTLATALALPYTTDSGQPFPERDLVIFLSFCVILVTLVGQGLTLGPLIQRLNFPRDVNESREMLRARREATLAALQRLDELEGESWVPNGMIDSMRPRFTRRLAQMPNPDGDSSPDPNAARAASRVLMEVAEAQRSTVREMLRRGEISDPVRRRFERELDAGEARLHH